MDPSKRLQSFIAYIPILGWIYVALFEWKNPYVRFHLRQSVGLVAFLVLVTLGWVVITWLTAWIPYGFILGVALFSLVLTAYLFGVIALIVGMANALRRRTVSLPMIGGFSSRLPI